MDPLKSLANDMIQVVRGIFSDIRASYPAYDGLGLDEKRLARLVKDRGLPVLMVDLPQVSAALLQGLEQGCLPTGFPNSRRVGPKDRRPRFMHGLWTLIFDENLCLKEDVDPFAIQAIRMLTTFWSKYEMECTPETVAKTIQEYHDVEQKMDIPTLRWDEDVLDPDRVGTSLHFRDGMDADLPLLPLDYGPRYSRVSDRAVGEVRVLLSRLQRNADALVSQFRYFSSVSFSAERYEAGQGIGFKHGRGAVAGSVNKWWKYRFVNWSAKLDRLYPKKYCAFGSPNGEYALGGNEEPSKLICVPKTQKGPRLIASEPAEHQWCQQALLAFLAEEFSRLWNGDFIDLACQEKSQTMVVSSSLDKSLATVDLSSASDRLSCWVVERMLRSNKSILHAIHASRTRWMRDDNGRDPVFLNLRKFASQGTAVTFPVQSLVFLICALTASGWEGNIHDLRKYRNRVRVYGDDIILPTSGYDDLRLILHALGLKVNDAKSFSQGNFRESCGMDSFMGIDVTPVKPKSFDPTATTSRQAIVDTANNLWKRGWWRTACAIEEVTIRRWPTYRLLRVVGRDDGSLGRISFVGAYSGHLRERWNDKLQRREVRTWSAYTNVRRKPVEGMECLLQFVTEAPWRSPCNQWSSGSSSKPQSRERLGWEVAA